MGVQQELANMRKNWIPYREANFVVIATSETSAGIEATAYDKFTAYRYRKILKEAGYWDVRVLAYNETDEGVQEEVRQVVDSMIYY